MTRPLPYVSTGTVSIFSLSDSLGFDPNLLVDLVEDLERNPQAVLEGLPKLRAAADSLEDYAVHRLRRSGRSWRDIGHYLGISRPAARKRHGGIS